MGLQWRSHGQGDGFPGAIVKCFGTIADIVSQIAGGTLVAASGVGDEIISRRQYPGLGLTVGESTGAGWVIFGTSPVSIEQFPGTISHFHIGI